MMSFADELITAAKDKILELCGEADPSMIAKGLEEFESYGSSLDEQRRTAVTRRQFLISQAQTAIRTLSMNKNATLAELEACLEKYVLDAVCFVYTCRRLIDLSLIAGTRAILKRTLARSGLRCSARKTVCTRVRPTCSPS